MYLIKQLFGEFAKPLFIAALFCAISGIYRLRGRRRTAAWLMAAAAAIVYLGATGLVGNALLEPLERQYPPLRDASLPAVGYVVVLGGGYEPRDDIPVTAALDPDGLARIVEGVRLKRRLGASRLVVSGGAPPDRVPSAFGYARLARDLGVDDASLIVLNGSLDTGAEARSIAALIGNAPFLLVTSAYHMPRAMRLMERAGARAYPAPTGQRVNKSANGGWRGLLPSSRGLRTTETALHEYLGLAALAAGVDQ
jgi:uncharacterized SAM-binding protein YcdF (DUF218 family)